MKKLLLISLFALATSCVYASDYAEEQYQDEEEQHIKMDFLWKTGYGDAVKSAIAGAMSYGVIDAVVSKMGRGIGYEYGHKNKIHYLIQQLGAGVSFASAMAGLHYYNRGTRTERLTLAKLGTRMGSVMGGAGLVALYKNWPES